MNLFITGFIQVALVTFQTWLIAKDKLLFIFPVAFLISLFWSFNVKRIAFGSLKDRIIYSTGAGCGALISIYLSIKLF